MYNASKIADVAWEGVYFFKIDYKNGYLHVPNQYIRSPENILEYYVFAVLPFGWKSSPLIYHSLTETVAMYLRGLGISILV